MKTAERIVIVLLLLSMIGAAAWLYFTVTYNRAELREAVARGEYEIRPEESTSATELGSDETVDLTVDTSSDTGQKDWRRYYPATVPIVIGETTVMASVADTLPERIQGLSNTPYLPDGVVKMFVFGALGTHSIWMKDMLYPIDIIWVSEEGVILHVEADVSPDTYPTSFSSPSANAWFVIEANAGFAEKYTIKKGDKVLVVE